MGLFDPPSKSIAKRVPVAMRPVLATVQVFAEDSLPPGLPPLKHNCLVGMVMAMWVNAHWACDTFEMSSWDAQSVITTYKNCARIAGSDAHLAQSIVSKLVDRGMMPPGVNVA